MRRGQEVYVCQMVTLILRHAHTHKHTELNTLSHTLVNLCWMHHIIAMIGLTVLCPFRW